MARDEPGSMTWPASGAIAPSNPAAIHSVASGPMTPPSTVARPPATMPPRMPLAPMMPSNRRASRGSVASFTSTQNSDTRMSPYAPVHR
jgi:hypothetical protein